MLLLSLNSLTKLIPVRRTDVFGITGVARALPKRLCTKKKQRTQRESQKRNGASRPASASQACRTLSGAHVRAQALKNKLEVVLNTLVPALAQHQLTGSTQPGVRQTTSDVFDLLIRASSCLPCPRALAPSRPGQSCSLASASRTLLSVASAHARRLPRRVCVFVFWLPQSMWTTRAWCSTSRTCAKLFFQPRESRGRRLGTLVSRPSFHFEWAFHTKR